jgi:hypothetical protein
MRQSSFTALAGLGTAIAVTTTMDATGYTMFSALPLLPLGGLFRYLQKFSRAEFGLVVGILEALRLFRHKCAGTDDPGLHSVAHLCDLS